MFRFLGSIFHFVAFGVFYGGWLGGVSGSFLLPVMGTIWSSGYGVTIGASAGFVIGVVVGILNLVWLPQEQNIQRYRTTLMWLCGVACCIYTGVVLVPPLLQLSGDIRVVPMFDAIDYLKLLTSLLGFVYVLPLEVVALVLGLIWSLLACTSVTSRYIHLERYDEDPLDAFGGVISTVRYYLTQFAQGFWFVFAIILALVGWVVYSFPYNTNMLRLIDVPFVVLGGLVGGFSLAILNGMLIGFLNRILFYEYYPEWSQEKYWQFLRIILFAFNALFGFLAVGIVGAIVASFIFNYIGKQYAKVYYSVDREKLKRKHKIGEKIDQPSGA